MREILFRGKNKLSGKWCEGFLVKTGDHFRISTQNDLISFGVDPETIGQYTGLKDKNGKRIFEGDIVEGRDYDEEDGFGVVEWVDGAFYVHNDSWCGTFFENYSGHNFEVIGNVHDNPDLIGGKEE